MQTTERPTMVENINVLQVGKYGVRVDEKTWFGVNEPLTPTHFVPNNGYKVSVVVSKTGKKYINQIIGTEVAQVVPNTTNTLTPPIAHREVHPAVAAMTTNVAVMPAAPTKALDEKSIQIQRQGLYQAALQSPALAQWAVNITEYLALVRQAAESGIAFVAERK